MEPIFSKQEGDFYCRQDTLSLAQCLLGCEIVHESPLGPTAGIIVETEAYMEHDPASHSYGARKTRRNEVMFGAAGRLYIYLIYGMYDCINVVSGNEGAGEAVLIRALQPTRGEELMYRRRQLHPKTGILLERKNKLLRRSLCNGPGKLTQAMGLRLTEHNGISLIANESAVFITGRVLDNFEIVATTRIGITKGTDYPYRFYVKGNPFVSKW